MNPIERFNNNLEQVNEQFPSMNYDNQLNMAKEWTMGELSSLINRRIGYLQDKRAENINRHLENKCV